MNLAFTRENMSVFDALPEMLSLDAWLPVWPFLWATAIVSVGLLFMLRRIVFRSTRATLISSQLAMLTASFGTLAYDQLRESGFEWLPSIGGCHCWLTAAAGILAAALMSILVALLALVTIRVVVALHECLSRYLERVENAVRLHLQPHSFCYGEPDWQALVPVRGPPLHVS